MRLLNPLQILRTSSRLIELIRPISTKLQTTENNIFLKDRYNQFKFNELIYLTHRLRDSILDSQQKSDLQGQKVAILCSNSYSYFVSLLAIWLANGVPVPLNKNYSLNYLEYFLKDSNAKLIINGRDLLETSKTENSFSEYFFKKQNIPVLTIMEAEFYRRCMTEYVPNSKYSVENFFKDINFSKSNFNEAMILYTSGSSGPSKGVILTFANLISQMESLISSWKLNSSDCILNVLPLNHVHGLIYSLLAPFYMGAQVDLLPKFDPEIIWQKLVDDKNSINIITAVPTVYVKLLDYHNKNSKFKADYNRTVLTEIFADKMRVIASASAPLNVQTFNNWLNLTGHSIVERYGLSETGVCLSNSLDEGNRKRISGTVGRPVANIQVRISALDEDLSPTGQVLIESDQDCDVFHAADDQEIVGELEVKGPMVFKEYLNKSGQTDEVFTHDGWFKTGDIAEFLKMTGIYKIIGRSSVDLIKSCGFKINARDIEKEILAHPCIEEVAVIGLDDLMQGQRVLALIVLKPDWKLNFLYEEPFNIDNFKRWLRLRLPKHCMPKDIEKIDLLPRNSMGKVNKKDLIKVYQQRRLVHF